MTSDKPIPFLLILLTVLTLILSACGSSASGQAAIATSVAMTVQAQNTQEAQFTPTPLPSTDIPPLLSSPIAGATKAPPTAPPTGSGNAKPCLSANFVVDVSYPDGTIVNPGSTFMKTWRVLNSGSCYWDSTYKFVYIDGDIMGGAYVYNFPGAAGPGETVDIPIQLYAPQEDGTYTGYWKIQSPDKTIFGVGQYDTPLSVKIVVGSGTPANNKTATVYNVTAVTYEVGRTCTSANTFYTVTAYITSNGPLTAIYEWAQSDGNDKSNNKITFTEAMTKSVSREWSVNRNASTNPRWMQIITTSPTYQEYAKITLPGLCW
ncbi:MAG: hypothetical protein HYR70_04950 [Chloroflexi bacterium]|nr:hypothetical protein [Chloroflexota bacterium]MBI1854528.1 hypothetical protein [Chloroflexota bacterium]MBI3338530.1 hypothetical protein [Chloroflexota bacterium]